jgi:c-di-GMP-binding flagellar brake protein YcgR
VNGALPTGAGLLIEHGGRTWRTQVVIGGEPLLVSVGELIPADLAALPAGTRLDCRLHDANGVLRFESRVLGRQAHGRLDCLRLSDPARQSHQQRRQHLRVTRRLPVKLRLPLKNETLSRAKGREMLFDCWVEALALNLSAGGLRLLLQLPRQHAVAPHRRAQLRFELGGREFRDKPLNFVRRDWSQDETLLVYQFAALDPGESEWIEAHNLRWVQRQPSATPPEEER